MVDKEPTPQEVQQNGQGAVSQEAPFNVLHQECHSEQTMKSLPSLVQY